MTEEKQTPRKNDKKRTSAIIRGIVLLVWLVIILTLAHDKLGGCFRLYREIGATPWNRPETVMEQEFSARRTSGEIKSAMLAVMALYESEYYSYNGVYLTKLVYEDNFSIEKEVGGQGRFIYIKSVIKTGYSYEIGKVGKNDIPAGKGMTYDDGYWTVEHLPDGSWKALSWTQEKISR
ncbi:MAG: hypothetical protein K6B74_10575 [Ruminococcus sp.]|nr:hypothetical protein [Ruminococcus sp.]